MTNHLCHNILTNQQWFLQQQETPTGVAWLAADFVGKGGCEGQYVSTHSLYGFPTCSYTPCCLWPSNPAATHAILLLVFLVYSVRMLGWSSLLITKEKRTPSSDQLCTDTVFSSFFEKKKLVRLQALAKSQNWPACWTSFFENKIGYFWKFLLDTFLPFIQILRNGHSF